MSRLTASVVVQRPDGQAGGRSGGTGSGQLVVVRVLGRRRRRKTGGHDRPAAQPAQLHHRQWPHRWVAAPAARWKGGKVFWKIVNSLFLFHALFVFPSQLSSPQNSSLSQFTCNWGSRISDGKVSSSTVGGDMSCFSGLIRPLSGWPLMSPNNNQLQRDTFFQGRWNHKAFFISYTMYTSDCYWLISALNSSFMKQSTGMLYVITSAQTSVRMRCDGYDNNWCFECDNESSSVHHHTVIITGVECFKMA